MIRIKNKWGYKYDLNKIMKKLKLDYDPTQRRVTRKFVVRNLQVVLCQYMNMYCSCGLSYNRKIEYSE